MARLMADTPKNYSKNYPSASYSYPSTSYLKPTNPTIHFSDGSTGEMSLKTLPKGNIIVVNVDCNSIVDKHILRKFGDNILKGEIIERKLEYNNQGELIKNEETFLFDGGAMLNKKIQYMNYRPLWIFSKRRSRPIELEETFSKDGKKEEMKIDLQKKTLTILIDGTAIIQDCRINIDVIF